MFQPNILEALAADRRRELEQEARRLQLLASIRPQRPGWRSRLGVVMQVVGDRLSAWGCRLEAAQAKCVQREVVVVAVPSRPTYGR
jgi:hypothetical protein